MPGVQRPRWGVGMTTELVKLDDGRMFVKGSEPKPEPEKAKYEPTPSRPTPGKKNILRSIINVPFARSEPQTTENLRFNFDKLESAGLSWDRPDREKIYNFARAHWKTEGEAPQIDNIRYHFEQLDDLEVTEELKIIETAEFFTRTNFAWLLGQEQEQDKHIAGRAAAREGWDILDGRHEPWKGKSVAERFEGMMALLHEKGAALTAGTKKDAKITHVGFDEILKSNGPIPWICEGLKMAPGTGPYMIGGYGFSGKTMAAQDMALSIATGGRIWGQFDCKRGRALHLDHEQGRYLTHDRYQRLARARGLDVQKLIADDSLRLAVFPSIKLDDPKAEEILTALFAEFDFVLIDSFGSACPSLEESSPQARIPLDLVSRACGEKTTALVLHHARKPSKDAPAGGKYSLRGSGNIFAALGGCFIFHGDDDEKNGPINVQHERERWRGVTMEDFALRIVDVEGEGNPHWGVAVEHLDEHAMEELRGETRGKALDKDIQKIAAYMTTLEGCVFEGNRTDLVKAARVNKKLGLDAVRAMVAGGQVRIEGKRITLRDEGKEALEALQ
jgi:AAA domain-containing protein